MAIKNPPTPQAMLVDKRLVQAKVAELNRQMGFVKDPTATAEKVQAMMLAAGIRPEDNILSSELLKMRYEEDEE